MKKIVWLLLLLLLPLALAEENLYLYDSLNLQLDVNGEFTLIADGGSPSVQQVKAEMLLFPKDNGQQEIIKLNTEGEVNENEITFNWNDKQLGKKEFSYSSEIETKNTRTKVKTEIPFPLTGIDKYKEYILSSETIDSDHPKIIAKATELIEGEDDAFKAAFKLANWVEENVEYDLSTLNAETSQKASWVLENRNGVCDEMTSLFVAMARAVGIPGRFVSGISYTTSELFDENWQPHGWAEIYLPEYGWVSFDITFGEYGYVDVTHVKLRDSQDPAEAATKYEWLANNVNLETKQLDYSLEILGKGNIETEEILLEQELLSTEVGFGSYNLVKGILKNTADYYVATTLRLAVPKEIQIIGDNKRTILLHPKEVRETYWTVSVPKNLNDKYEYSFPTIIYSEKNVTVQDLFKAGVDKATYSEEEIKELTVQDEEKVYSRKVSFNCNYPKEIKINEKSKITCSVKNSGNTNLDQVKFCLAENCKTINLPINQLETMEKEVEGTEVGWNKLIISAESSEIEKKSAIEFLVLDAPELEIDVQYPEEINYGDLFNLNLILEQKSFSNPQEIVITVTGLGIENKWTIDKIIEKEELALELDTNKISTNNKFKITTMWKDKEGKLYSDHKEIEIKGKGNNFSEKVKMFLNKIINLFV
ncbi:transglutaminase domain-containing protein [Candidatus Woesearchaeota archaeon]|jgi:hypothetical protein|nr:transglutaminase domain-containing protein [Candidatus Woesearchaeota archaeon]MBT4111109.1 transglutaminase domain-containing protein [Candidatus Woesearchaeota archaeon]MBT4335753.1 transglutaminase domain-containing protein [Candidatus Woesearchaeota archaeon]MBT4469276.1 transglutaminase domain-containing protein [Candidatus Woesearchaeota archaeon]MBT6744248.1 transglutaminase domain-containing protein [Candidatus Woesearchaeota archaeon]